MTAYGIYELLSIIPGKPNDRGLPHEDLEGAL